jgi:hypothetical protein
MSPDERAKVRQFVKAALDGYQTRLCYAHPGPDILALEARITEGTEALAILDAEPMESKP